MITSVMIGGNSEPSTSEYNILTSIKDEMDLGTMMIPFSSRNTRYEPLTLVDVLLQGIHEYWWLDTDIATVVDKQDKTIYEHKITLIELTKIFERTVMPNRSLVQLSTGTKITGLDAVNIVFDTVPFRNTADIASGRLIDSIETTLSAKLDAIDIPDMFLTGRTILEFLIAVFELAGINGFPRLTRDISGNFILDADYYNELVALVNKDTDSYFEQEVQSSTKYAKALNYTANNQVYSFDKLRSALCEPSPNEWLGVRSDTSLVKVDDAYIPLEEVLDELVKVEAFIEYSGFQVPSTSGTFDITDWVLEEEERGNLQPTSPDGQQLAQENTLGYSIGGDKKLTHVFEIVDTDVGIVNIELLYLAKLLDVGVTLPVIEPGSLDPDNIKIRVYYTSKINTIQEVERIDLSEVSNESTLIIGQSDSFVASDRVLDASLSRANRSGNKEATTKAAFITDISTIYKKGSYTASGQVITDVERVVYNGHAEALYTWTVDFQKISDFIGLNSESKIFEVESVINRTELYKEYVILDTESVPNTSFVQTFGIQVFANTIADNPGLTFDKKIYAAAFRSPEIPGQIISGKSLRKAVTPSGGGNMIGLDFSFKHFKNAGKQLVQDGVKFYNKNLEYTDGDGRFIDFKVKYVNEYASDPNLLPQIDDPSSNVHIDTALFRTHKNQPEVFGFRYQLMVYPKQSRISDFVVGNYLTKNNNLIIDKGGVFDNLVVYTSTERYFLSNNAKTKGINIGQDYSLSFITVGSIIGFKIDLDTPLGTEGTPLNWAIGDANGNLYLAVNQIKYDDSFENINSVFFNFVKERY